MFEHDRGGRRGNEGKGKATWRHVKGGTATKIRREEIRGSKAKIGQLDSHALVGDQNVFRLEIPVVNP